MRASTANQNFQGKTSKLAAAFTKNWSGRAQNSSASTIFFKKLKNSMLLRVRWCPVEAWWRLPFTSPYSARTPKCKHCLGKNLKLKRRQILVSVFVKVFQAQILRKHPRRSCGSFWSGLELRRPKFDRFRHFVLNFFWFF